MHVRNNIRIRYQTCNFQIVVNTPRHLCRYTNMLVSFCSFVEKSEFPSFLRVSSLHKKNFLCILYYVFCGFIKFLLIIYDLPVTFFPATYPTQKAISLKFLNIALDRTFSNANLFRHLGNGYR